MIQKLLNVSIVVKDQKKAVDFYTKTLGFDIKTDFTPSGGQRYVTVAPKEQDVEMVLFEVDSSSEPRFRNLEPGKSGAWTFVTNDIRKDFGELKARGVQFNEVEPQSFPWGQLATFTDPDGNNFTLLQRPSR